VKAFLLTAGLGTRLRPLTDHTPKCLLPIAGRPLIDYWFDLFERYGIDDVLINLHHLPEQVESYLKAKRFQGAISTSFEPELLGSAGTVFANRHFVDNADCFFIFYGDNLTNIRIDRWLAFHRAHDGDLTLMLYPTDKPELKGIVELDGKDKVISFEEKPSHPRSNLASAGMYIATPDILDAFPSHRNPLDMAYDVLPRLTGRMYGMLSDDIILDIGTPEDYEYAQQIAHQLKVREG
jgi:mannose-1-phosphate guanylyltransferase